MMYTFPEKGLSEDMVTDLLKEMRSRDCPYDRLLSTMCTRPHPVAVRAYSMFLETNLGDPGLFPGTAEIERRVVGILGSLLGCSDATGYVSTGGTESNIQAVRAARNSSGRRDGNIVVPRSAHFSFDKIADLLNLEVRKAELDESLRVDVGDVERLIDDRTVCLVGIAGTTEFGQVDPIGDLSELAIENGIPLHVDAAFGGFVLPFLEKDCMWDFRAEGVQSITIDPHKMGMSPIPAGGLIFRSSDPLRRLETETYYLTVSRQASLTGTRSGAAAAATYAVIMHLGIDGYRKVVRRCMDMTEHLVSEARAMGIEPVIEPVMNVVALRVDDPPGVRRALLERGWHVSMTREPKALRLILMPHMTDENLDLFLSDLEDVLISLRRGG
ncbi:tyrosine decarboxylase MfnA [Methanothrix thermoacetophila]|nr:tyrosine decarboxylase MfnA [Methanothrix thermoacetophila]ABK15403.1 Pyridoxal-dependent decarboxylase [Methanothrix thermoacetophila PT]